MPSSSVNGLEQIYTWILGQTLSNLYTCNGIMKEKSFFGIFSKLNDILTGKNRDC